MYAQEREYERAEGLLFNIEKRLAGTNDGNRCIPGTSPYIRDFEISPAVEWDAGVQEESRLVFPEIVLQIESA